MVASRQQAQTKMVMAASASVPTKARLLMIQCMRYLLLIRMVWWVVWMGVEILALSRYYCGARSAAWQRASAGRQVAIGKAAVS